MERATPPPALKAWGEAIVRASASASPSPPPLFAPPKPFFLGFRVSLLFSWVLSCALSFSLNHPFSSRFPSHFELVLFAPRRCCLAPRWASPAARRSRFVELVRRFAYAHAPFCRARRGCLSPRRDCPRRPPRSFRRNRSTLGLRARARPVTRRAERVSIFPAPAALVSSNALDALLTRAQFLALEAVVFLPGRTPRRPPRSLRRTRSTLGSRARAQLRGARSGFPSSQRPPRSFRRARSTLCLRARPILRRARRGPRLPPPFESVPRSGTKLVPLRFPKQRTKGYARCGCEGSLHPIKRTAQSSGYVLAI